MCVAAIADKYLACGMQDLSERFNLSPTLAAITLIAFANGAPDILSSSSAATKPDGALISVGALFGSFIFAGTLVVANVVLNSKEAIVFPKLAITKELFFYGVSVIAVSIFGLIGTSGYAFVGTYMGIYVTYLITSIFIEKIEQKDKVEGDDELDQDMENPTDHSDVLTVNESRAFEAVIPIEESDPNLAKKKDTFVNKIMEELKDPESSSLENMILAPLMACGLLTICYLDNPLMKTILKYLLIASSVMFTIYTLELLEVDFLVLLLIGLGFGLVSLIAEMLKVPSSVTEVVYELISVFSAIGYISIFSGLIIDFISFLAFYFSIDEVILNSILLSAGNTIGDFFGNAALAKAGEGVMGAFATYSGQIFNNFIGFSASIYSATKAEATKFNIFGL